MTVPRKRFDIVFGLTVAVPALVAVIYYAVIASDVYVSESRFVVRGPQRQSQAAPGTFRQGAILPRSQDDTYLIHDYMLSRDAVRELERQVSLREAYDSRHGDFINRFPGIDGDGSFEAFYGHYKKQVALDYDTGSSITTLKIRAFSAEDARKINDALLNVTEQVFGNLIGHSYQEIIKDAEREVSAAGARSKAAAQRLTVTERNAGLEQGVPLPSAGSGGARERAVSGKGNDGTPSRVEMTTDGLDKAVGKPVAGQNTPADVTLPRDQLALEMTLAEQQLSAALSTLASVRSEALRARFHLERLVQPNLPDQAAEPRRIRSVLVVVVLGLIAWGVVSLIIASVREHLE